MHRARVATQAGEIIRAAQLPVCGLVVVVQIGQVRKIDCAYRNVCSIVRIISGQRNVGISAYGAGKKSAAKIDNLQSIIGKEQSCGDAIEGQSFSKEIVVYPVRTVDRNLEMRVLAAAKLRSEERRVGKECKS